MSGLGVGDRPARRVRLRRRRLTVRRCGEGGALVTGSVRGMPWSTGVQIGGCEFARPSCESAVGRQSTGGDGGMRLLRCIVWGLFSRSGVGGRGRGMLRAALTVITAGEEVDVV